MKNQDPHQPINVDRLFGTFSDEPEFIAEMYEMFVGDAQGLLTNFDTALESENVDDLRKLAHTLKGSSANIGAERLQSLASAVEMADLTTELTKVQDLAKEMRMELEAVEAFVKNFIPTLNLG
jgi:HPt (histidine-containing phosphotransfer) domain-containing protein